MTRHGARDKATKHIGNARIDRHEARWFTKGSAATTKHEAKREMRKAVRALSAAEIAEAVAMAGSTGGRTMTDWTGEDHNGRYRFDATDMSLTREGWGGYRVVSDPPYETLVAPDGTEVCTLGEPEDRTFGRDLAPLIARLAAAERDRDEARAGRCAAPGSREACEPRTDPAAATSEAVQPPTSSQPKTLEPTP